MTVNGETKVPSENVSWCQFGYHKCHINCPGFKPLLHKPMFCLKAVSVGFVLDKVVLGEVFV